MSHPVLSSAGPAAAWLTLRVTTCPGRLKASRRVEGQVSVLNHSDQDLLGIWGGSVLAGLRVPGSEEMASGFQGWRSAKGIHLLVPAGSATQLRMQLWTTPYPGSGPLRAGTYEVVASLKFTQRLGEGPAVPSTVVAWGPQVAIGRVPADA